MLMFAFSFAPFAFSTNDNDTVNDKHGRIEQKCTSFIVGLINVGDDAKCLPIR